MYLFFFSLRLFLTFAALKVLCLFLVQQTRINHTLADINYIVSSKQTSRYHCARYADNIYLLYKLQMYNQFISKLFSHSILIVLIRIGDQVGGIASAAVQYR